MNETVSIELRKSDGSVLQTYETIASEHGDWKIQMLVGKDDQYQNMTIRVNGSDTKVSKVAKNVLSGDVYFCSGHSNM